MRNRSKGGGRGKPAARSPSASRRHLSSSSSSWGRARRPRSTPAPYGWSPSSSSSSSTDDEVAPSSSSDGEAGGEEAETRTLFSSLSLSSDSSEFYRSSTRKGHRSTTARRALPRSTGEVAPGDAFRPLVSVETKKHRGLDERKKKGEDGVMSVKKPMGAAAEEPKTSGGAGMAVVKRSRNPYLDFRSSMVEMVVERRIGSVGRMEELLGSYLSLNSPRHHPAILAAFEDVWEAVFGQE